MRFSQTDYEGNGWRMVLACMALRVALQRRDLDQPRRIRCSPDSDQSQTHQHVASNALRLFPRDLSKNSGHVYRHAPG
jgi:hypothetical protein